MQRLLSRLKTHSIASAPVQCPEETLLFTLTDFFRHRCPTVKRENSSVLTKSSKHPEEPPAKKSKEEKKPEEKEGEEVKVAEEEEEKDKEEEMQSSGEEQKEENSAEKNPEVSNQKLKSCEDVSQSDK